MKETTVEIRYFSSKRYKSVCLAKGRVNTEEKYSSGDTQKNNDIKVFSIFN